VNLPRETRFYIIWGALFVAGLLALSAPAGAGLGRLIVAPTILCGALMLYGYVAYKIVKRFGGDPEGSDNFGLWVFVSLAVLVLPLLKPRLRSCFSISRLCRSIHTW
jgi:hypothetical protein